MSAEKILRFSCPACGARLGIAEAQRGKQLDCPSCGRRLKLPAKPDSDPNDAKSPAPARSATTSDDDLFSQPTVSSAASRPVPPKATASEPEPDDEVPVVCGVCHTRMYAPVSQIGQKIRCPDCYAYTEVKAVAKPQRRSMGGAAGRGSLGSGSLGSGILAGNSLDGPEADEYRLQDTDAPSKFVDAATVPVVCEVCHTRMYARPDQMGQYLTCPDCGRLNRIEDRPESPRRARTAQSTADDVRVESQGAARVNPFREQADQLLRNADEELDRREQEKPEVPARPMIQGIYSFLWQRSIRVLWGVVSGLVALVMFIIAYMLAGDDPRRFIPGLLIMIVAVPLMCGFLATQLVAIVYNSSEGHNDLVHPPENHFVDWVADSWLIACAMAYACFPGYLLYNAHGSLELALGLAGPLAFFLFPILFLSMLEIGSRFIPFSGAIWLSLARHPGSWFLFYIQAAGLFVATAALMGGAVMARNLPAQIVCGLAGSIVLAASLLIYFRLLGRLVLVCGTMDSDYGTVRQAAAEEPPARGDKAPSPVTNADADLLIP
ncbi:MAG: hypothetical protein U0795_22640 [Pirellulales bacterium]